MRTYVLVKVRMGAMSTVAASAGLLDGVTHVVEMLGPFDVLLEIRPHDVAGQDAILERIRRIPGVDRAVPCPLATHVIRLEPEPVLTPSP
jgi:DNA-binding Lrp family transcriptional regulator